MDTVLDECGSLRRAVSDTRVLHENWPRLASSQLKPLKVGDSFVGRDAVDLSQGPQFDSRRAKQCRHLEAPEAAVDEEA